MRRNSILILVLIICPICISFAQNIKVLKVGYISSPPLVIEKNGELTGISIDLWKQIAEYYHWQYSFVSMGTDTEKALDELTQGKVDVLIGMVSITHKNIKTADFSRSYYINRVGLLETVHHLNFWSYVGHIIGHLLKWSLLILVALFVILVFLYWKIEKPEKPYDIDSKLQAFFHTFWLFSVIFFSGSLLVYPKTALGRIISLIMLIITFIFLTTIIGTVTSAFNLSLSNKNLTSFNVLRNRKFATIKGQAAAEDGRLYGGVPMLVDSMKEAERLLLYRRVSAIVGDYLELQYYLEQHYDSKLFLSPATIAFYEVGFAYPRDVEPDLRLKVDSQLTILKRDDTIQQICVKYLSSRDISQCAI